MIDEAGLKHVEPAFFLGLDKQRPPVERPAEELSPTCGPN